MSVELLLTLAFVGQSFLIFALIVWVNKLINKVMSRNFYDYRVTSEMRLGEKADKVPKDLKVEQEEFEDLSYVPGG